MLGPSNIFLIGIHLDRRNMLGSAEEFMVAGLHHRKDPRCNSPAVSIPCPRQSIERRYRITLEEG